MHIICAFCSLVIHIKNFLCHKFDSSVKFLDDGRAVGAGGGMASPDYDRSVKWGTDYTHYITKGQLISKCLQFLQKKEQKQVDLRYHSSSKVEFIRSFFGRNVGLKKSFRLCLTFTCPLPGFSDLPTAQLT